MAFYMKFSSTAMAAVFVVVVMATTSLTEAQQIPECASKLADCAVFISNSTIKPDTACCKSIADAVANDLSCLCTLYNTPGVLSSFNISVTDALRVSRDCNAGTDLSKCNSTASSPMSPPGVPGRDDNGAGSRVAWTGITSLLLFWASSMMLF
ncbi:hypothetical protein Dsin_004694 [Dipteronia sinensis]|uniref:Bifunctional inhibitor/plant lipid transfer protein/seed storage helical domain-containing protein n=1 Tax=Dipteronia sinensis TaxID=43782 RepID=A0AAE0AWD1_9ROSI|nr:hypothetical protein Dsin_004694 [Dipteronia sinensis]